jgi:hypothetical protein
MDKPTDERDPPIEPQNYVAGFTVVDIGDVRVARGMSRRHHSSCPHSRLVYDNKERRIWCKDCERDVEGFDAFQILAERYGAATRDLERRQKAMDEAETFRIRTIAGKMMDEAWRSHKMVPSCPYCHNGLFPEDFKHGPSMIGKDFARARSTKRIPDPSP